MISLKLNLYLVGVICGFISITIYWIKQKLNKNNTNKLHMFLWFIFGSLLSVLTSFLTGNMYGINTIDQEVLLGVPEF